MARGRHPFVTRVRFKAKPATHTTLNLPWALASVGYNSRGYEKRQVVAVVGAGNKLAARSYRRTPMENGLNHGQNSNPKFCSEMHPLRGYAQTSL